MDVFASFTAKQLVSTSTSEDGRAGGESRRHLTKKINDFNSAF